MKVAILGGGPKALETAIFLKNLGAHIKVFSANHNGGTKIFSDEMKLPKPWKEILTDETAALINIADQDVYPTQKEFQETYIAKLLNELEGDIKKCRIRRVHKAFLNPGESIEGSSRFADLFRVVYSVDPKVDVDEQEGENPDVFNQLHEEILEHLKSEIEMYEDFDIIIDAMGTYANPLPMGASNAQAIGEQRIDELGFTQYGAKALEYIRNEELPRDITIIGSGNLAVMALKELMPKLQNKEIKLHLITSEKEAFAGIENESLKEEVQTIFTWCEQEKKDLQKEYELAYEKWDQHEDYVKVKIPRPTLGTSSITWVENSNVLSVDHLTDRKGSFITVQNRPFGGAEIQMTTIKADKIFVLTGHQRKQDLFIGMEVCGEDFVQSEKGLFRLPAGQKYQNMKELMNNLKSELLKLFSKA